MKIDTKDSHVHAVNDVKLKNWPTMTLGNIKLMVESALVGK